MQVKGEVGLPRWLSVKESACNAGDLTGDAGSIPGGWEDPLEEGMATHFSIVA